MGTIRDIQKYIDKSHATEDKYGIPRGKLTGVLYAESRFREDVISGKKKSTAGAIGIGQFMPLTAKEYGIDPTDPMQSIEAAGKYLSSSYKTFGNWDDAIMSYNMGVQGLKNVKSGKKQLPKETANYIVTVNNYTGDSNKGTTNVTNLQETDYTPIFAQQEVTYTPNVEEEKEDKEIEELTKENQEREFVKEYKASIVQQEVPKLQEQVQEQTPLQYNLTDIYNQVSQFVDTPIAQQGKVYVENKNDPRYQAYQDSLRLFNNNDILIKNAEAQGYEIINIDKDTQRVSTDGKKLPIGYPQTHLKNKLIDKYKKGTINSSYNMKKEDGYFYSVDDLVPGIINPSLKKQLLHEKINPTGSMAFRKPLSSILKEGFGNHAGDVRSAHFYNTNPKQEVLVKQTELVRNIKPTAPKPIFEQREKLISIPSITPKGIQESSFNISAQLPQIREQAQIPTSYNVEYSAQRMNGGTGYYDGNNVQNVSAEVAIRAKEQADRANAEFLRKYGKSTHPNAIERLKQLRDEAVITPNYQQGGYTNFEELYNNLRQDEKNNEKSMLERIPSNRFEIQGGQTSAQLRSKKEAQEVVQQGGFQYSRKNQLTNNVYLKEDRQLDPQEMQSGGVIKDQQGQRKYPFKVTEIQGNTMATNGYGNIPLLVKPNVGKSQIIEANSGEYKFEGATKFTEFPITEAEKQFLKAYNGLKR
jgi:hypothetical protein